MKVLGKRVLVQQVMTKKKSIIMLKGGKDEDTFNIEFRVLQLGPQCPKDEIQVGEIPIFGKHIQFNTVKVVEKTDDKVILNAIVFYDDIEGIDDESIEKK